jgi:hypothetical protein
MRSYTLAMNGDGKPPIYVAWIATTVAGVIIAHFAIRQYQVHEATEMMKQITRASQQQSAAIRAEAARIQQKALAEAKIQREQAEAQRLEKVRQLREKRTGDATGSRLSRQCDEWTRTAESMKKSDYALQEKSKFCGQLESYVNHGLLPRP